jgi:hypothetical protein
VSAGETPGPGGRIARRRFLGVLGAGGGAAAVAASLGFRGGGPSGEASGGHIAGTAHPATAFSRGHRATNRRRHGCPSPRPCRSVRAQHQAPFQELPWALDRAPAGRSDRRGARLSALRPAEPPEGLHLARTAVRFEEPVWFSLDSVPPLRVRAEADGRQPIPGERVTRSRWTDQSASTPIPDRGTAGRLVERSRLLSGLSNGAFQSLALAAASAASRRMRIRLATWPTGSATG